MEEENVVNEEVNETKEEVKEEKPVSEKKFPVVSVLLGIVCVGLIIALCLALNGNRTKFTLAEVYESYFADKEGSVTLPKNYLVCKNGQLLYNDDGIATVKGTLFGADMSEDEFNEMIDGYKESYELSEITGKDYVGYGFVYNVDPTDETNNEYVYMLYKDGILIQVITLDENDAQTILNSVKF